MIALGRSPKRTLSNGSSHLLPFGAERFNASVPSRSPLNNRIVQKYNLLLWDVRHPYVNTRLWDMTRILIRGETRNRRLSHFFQIYFFISNPSTDQLAGDSKRLSTSNGTPSIMKMVNTSRARLLLNADEITKCKSNMTSGCEFKWASPRIQNGNIHGRRLISYWINEIVLWSTLGVGSPC